MSKATRREKQQQQFGHELEIENGVLPQLNSAENSLLACFSAGSIGVCMLPDSFVFFFHLPIRFRCCQSAVQRSKQASKHNKLERGRNRTIQSNKNLTYGELYAMWKDTIKSRAGERHDNVVV